MPKNIIGNREEHLDNMKLTEIINEEIPLIIGDVIIEINREKINNVNQFRDYVSKIKQTGRSSVLLRVIRDRETIWVTLKYLQNN